MKKSIIIAMLSVGAMMAGCSKNSTSDPSTPYDASAAIEFSSTPDNWDTKSTVLSDKNLKEMGIFAYYTKQNSWISVAEGDIEQFMYNQFAEIKDGEDVWSYTPVKYWPNNSGEKITFYAVSPHEAIATTTDAETGKPLFNYTSNAFAEYNDDLLAAVVYDKEKDSDGVKFDFNHALTRIKISAKTLNSGATIEGERNVRYTVNGVMFYNIMSQNSLTLDANGNIVWGDELSGDYNLTATNGYTLLNASDDSYALNDESFTDVCATDKAIFVIPQPIETTTATTKPKVEIRIRKSYEYTSSKGEEMTGYVIYIPEAVELPTPDKDGWEMGDFINMKFTFDASADNPTPLTVLSEIYQYTDANVDVNINHNIYIYTDENDTIEIGKNDDTAQMRFFTNYSQSDLTEKDEITELDGSTTTSYGFIFFFTDDYSSYIVPTYNETTGKYTITLSESYDFTYSVLKQTRDDLGLTTSILLEEEEQAGINRQGGDSVYTLTIDVNDDHLALYTANDEATSNTTDAAYGMFKGTIGVQMLSGSGGMITKLFPITLKKTFNE